MSISIYLFLAAKSNVPEVKNTRKKTERVRKQHVPELVLSNIKKQYIDGGGSLGDERRALGDAEGSLGGGASLGDAGGLLGNGGSLGNGESPGAGGYEQPEVQPNYVDNAGNSLSQQQNIANTLKGAGLSLDSGLSQDGMSQGDNGVNSMTNDLVDGSESTDGRQLVGNGKKAMARMDMKA